MSGISFELNVGEALANLSDLKSRLDNAGGFYRNVGKHLQNSTRDNFAREAGPDGTPWKPLLPSTIRGRVRKNQLPLKILQATKNTGLMASINIRATDESVSIGTPKPYGAAHQLGATIKKPARKGVLHLKRNEKTGEIGNRFVKKSKSNVVQDVNIPAHTVTIPARPFLGVSDNDVQAIIGIADHWLNG